MKRCCLLLFLFFSLLLSLEAQEKIKATVYFDTDEHTLNTETMSALKESIQTIRELPEYSVEIHAHTDRRGSNKYNDRLAERRAQTVYDYLAQYGIPAEKVISHSYGENQPVSDLDAEAGWRQNRRVEVVIYPFLLKNLNDALSRISTCQEQTFTIDPTRFNRLEGANGTVVWVEEMSFLDADGRTVEAGSVQLVLREAYSADAMITTGLSTFSEGRMLETGGMISLEAFAEGRPLEIREGKSMTVALPADFRKEGMELFSAVENEAASALEWQPAGQQARENLEYKLKRMRRPQMPVLDYPLPKPKYKKPTYPDAPKSPRKPYPPIEPKRESIQYNPPLIKRLTMGKKKIEEKEEAIYQEKLQEYQEKKEKYSQDMMAYEQALEKYKERLAEHQRQITLVDRRRQEEIDNFYDSPEYRAEMEKYQKAREKLNAVYQEKLAAWRAEKQRLLEEFEARYGLSGSQGSRLLNSYFFDVTELGWINCDRFVEVPQDELVQVQIADPDKTEERIFLVFEDINSIISASRRESGYVVNNMPSGRKVKIIGLKVENGRAHVAMHDTTIKEKIEYNLEYQPYRLAEIKDLLASL